MARELIFVSGVQKELAQERRALAAFVRGHPLLGRFFDVFLFEELPATDRRAGDLYLEKVDEAGIYVGLFGREYGTEDAQGLSPTEREFDRATERGTPRLVFVKGGAGEARHPKMAALIRRAERQLVRRRFSTSEELTGLLLSSLVDHLERTGVLRRAPFADAACPGASVRDLEAAKVEAFVRTARQAGRLTLTPATPVMDVLAHLDLLADGQPTYSAVLLFGRRPQQYLPAAQVKCLHFHGTEVGKPIPSYQLFEDTLFDQVDEAVDFVLSKLARSVGVREPGAQAPVAYDVPEPAVAEAVVNAVAHRDYASPAGVQVHVFSDRVEIWNPGALPPSLTPEGLRVPHASLPRNPRIANVLFRAKYIEQAGTGTLDMIARCREAGLPEPDFEQRGGEFVVTLWRDRLTVEALARLVLNDRQTRAIAHLRTVGRLTNAEYQRVTGSTRKTAARDLDGLVVQGALERKGTVGRGAYYVAARGSRGRSKWDINGTNETSGDRRPKGVTKGPKEPSKLAPGKKRRSTNPRLGPTRPVVGSKGLTKGSEGSSGPSRPASRTVRRGVRPQAETRQKPAKPDMGSPSRGSLRGKDAEPSPERSAGRSTGRPLRGPRK